MIMNQKPAIKVEGSKSRVESLRFKVHVCG